MLAGAAGDLCGGCIWPGRRMPRNIAGARRCSFAASVGSRLIRCGATSEGERSHEAEIVEGDLAEIESCDAVLAAFTSPDEGTAMEAWYAHSLGKRVIAYTGGTPPHPWTVYVADAVHTELERAVGALGEGRAGA